MIGLINNRVKIIIVFVFCYSWSFCQLPTFVSLYFCLLLFSSGWNFFSDSPFPFSSCFEIPCCCSFLLAYSSSDSSLNPPRFLQKHLQIIWTPVDSSPHPRLISLTHQWKTNPLLALRFRTLHLLRIPPYHQILLLLLLLLLLLPPLLHLILPPLLHLLQSFLLANFPRLILHPSWS